MGKLQNEDFKTEAEITGAGGAASQLLNDSKIYVTALSLNKTLDDAITAGDFASPVFVGAKYTATSLTNSIPNTSSATIFDCPTSVFDSHSAVTTGATWKFTVPTAQGGKYDVGVLISLDSYAWVVNDYLIADVFVNGSAVSNIQWHGMQASWTGQLSVGGRTIVSVAAGDEIDVRLLSTRTAGSITAIEANAIRNHIEIIKVG